MEDAKAGRVRLIEVITAPLGFFVLALLIVEAFLGTVLIATNLDAAGILQCIWLGVAMFVMVVGIVAVLVWYRPDNLTFDKAAHLSRIVGQISEQLGHSEQVQEILREAIFDRSHGRYADAAVSYERALLIDPKLEEAKIGWAVVKSYAETTNLSEPLRILDEVILGNPRSEKAFYNRACIRCLSEPEFTKEAWLSDLKEAIRLRPQ